MQPDPLTSQEEMKEPDSAPQEVKVAKRSILPVVVVLLLIIVGGVGFLAYRLNTGLTDTRQQLSALQSEHDQLQSDYDALKSTNAALSGDLGQTQADLEKANGELATTQTNLQNSQDQNQAQASKIDSASKKADILFALFDAETPTDFLALDTAIKATNDQQLLTQWQNFFSAPTAESSLDLFLFLTKSIQNDLK